MAVNDSSISRIIESIMYVQGLTITCIFRFGGYNNKSPHLMEVSSNPKKKLLLI